MKKNLLSFIVSMFFALCFGMPNMSLRGYDYEIFCISDNVMYRDSDYVVGEIVDGNVISLENGTIVGQFSEDSKHIIYMQFTNDVDEYDIWKFDKKTKIIKYRKYSYGGTELFMDEDGILFKEINYLEDGQIEKYICYDYDKKTKEMTSLSYYSPKDQLLYRYVYNSKTGTLDYIDNYGKNGKVASRYVFDSNSVKLAKKVIYDENLTETEVFNFIKFNKDGIYELNDDYYLQIGFCYYYELEDYLGVARDWNEFYTATIKKIEFDFSYYEYGYFELRELIDENYLIENSFTLCKKNSKTYYCFNVTNDYEIDFSNCYEIQLEKKDLDYRAMNKTGKGSGPFGFDIGMTIEEVSEACIDSPINESNNLYSVKPKKKHRMFDDYYVWISEKYGVYCTKAVSDFFEGYVTDDDIKDKFNDLLSILEKKYGDFNVTDNFDLNSYKTNNSVERFEVYKACWKAADYEDNDTKFDGLRDIMVCAEKVKSYNSQFYFIWIQYAFKNTSDALDLLDSVL